MPYCLSNSSVAIWSRVASPPESCSSHLTWLFDPCQINDSNRCKTNQYSSLSEIAMLTTDCLQATVSWSLLVWSLPLHLSGMGDPTRRQCSSQHSLWGHRNMQATPPKHQGGDQIGVEIWIGLKCLKTADPLWANFLLLSPKSSWYSSDWPWRDEISESTLELPSGFDTWSGNPVIWTLDHCSIFQGTHWTFEEPHLEDLDIQKYIETLSSIWICLEIVKNCQLRK